MAVPENIKEICDNVYSSLRAVGENVIRKKVYHFNYDGSVTIEATTEDKESKFFSYIIGAEKIEDCTHLGEPDCVIERVPYLEFPPLWVYKKTPEKSVESDKE